MMEDVSPEEVTESDNAAIITVLRDIKKKAKDTLNDKDSCVNSNGDFSHYSHFD